MKQRNTLFFFLNLKKMSEGWDEKHFLQVIQPF